MNRREENYKKKDFSTHCPQVVTIFQILGLSNHNAVALISFEGLNSLYKNVSPRNKLVLISHCGYPDTMQTLHNTRLYYTN